MTAAHRRYLRVEMTVATVISAVLSLGFAILIFGGLSSVPVAGAGGLIVDALPQSFMIALMSILVPTLLTRRRVAAGGIASRPTGLRLPAAAVPRALLIALVVMPVAGLAHWLLLPLTGPAWAFASMLAYKVVYGGVLGAVVARVATVAALGDAVSRVPGGTGAANSPRDG